MYSPVGGLSVPIAQKGSFVNDFISLAEEEGESESMDEYAALSSDL